MIRPSVAVLLVMLAVPAAAWGQGTKADYARADGLYWGAYGAVRHARVVPHWAKGGNAFWYATVEADWSFRFWYVDCLAGTKRLAFDPAKLAGALYDAHVLPAYLPRGLPVADIDPGPGDNQLRVAVGGRWVTVDLATYKLSDVRLIRDAGFYPHRLPKLDGPGSTNWSDEQEDVARVLIVNRSGGPVKVDEVWGDVSRHGFRDHVGDGCDTVESVWSGQVLAVSDADGLSLGYWRAGRDGGMLVVDPPPGGPRPHSRRSLWAAVADAFRGGDASTRPTTAPASQPTAIRRRPRPTTRAADEGAGVRSPDGQWVAYTHGHDVWVRSADPDDAYAPVRLTRDGTASDGYDYDANLYWAPDSAHLVALRWTDGSHPQLPLVHGAPTDQLRAKLEQIDYRVAGDAIGHAWPHLLSVARQREVPIAGLDAADPEYCGSPVFDGDPTRFVFSYQRRGHQLARVFTVDTATGRGRTLVEERADPGSFIDDTQRFVWFDAKTNQVLWASERDGHNHLYRYDARTGRLLNQVTRGDYVVQPWDEKCDEVDVRQHAVFFRAVGVPGEDDPYAVHFCRVELDGTDFRDLTPDGGTHTIQDAPNGDFFLDTYSRVDQPPVTDLRRYGDYGLVCPIERADIGGLLLTGWRPPERFVAKGRDGQTDIHGVIYRPQAFDAGRKYPVVEDIYAGPQEASVPHGFARWRWPQTIAELGFIVVQVDGMGTPQRGRAFHDVAWHNWGDCGLDDRAAWIKAAAAAHPEMDLSRGVGVEGGSFGGYAAVRALEAHPELYTVAVAQDGCYDARLYAQWYSEQYMGWPVGTWYAKAAADAHVGGIARSAKLLLIVDETDHNVAPIVTERMVDALTKADKDFDLLSVPNGDHMQGGDYIDRRRKDYLVRHLMGVEPRAK